VGLVTALGHGFEATWRALLEGRTGVRAVDPSAPTPAERLGAVVEPPLLRARVPEHLESQAKFVNDSGQLATDAIEEALGAAGVAAAGIPPERRALYLAQSDYTRANCIDFRPAVVDATGQGAHAIDAEVLNRSSIHKVNPFVLLETLNNNAFSFLSALFELRGSNTSLSGFSGPGVAAIALAAGAVRRGGADVAVAAGASRPAGPVPRHELETMRMSSRGRDGAASFRPLDRRRDGLVPGEGGAALVLEPLAAARARGAKPLAVVLGHGGATHAPADGSHAPPAAAVLAAARAAMAEAKARPEDLLGVVAPGTGSPEGDRASLEAIRALLGGRRVPVVAWKGATGHMTLASDVGEAALAARGLSEGVLPGTVGFERADPGFEDVAVSATAVRGAGAGVLVLCAGLDGQAAALVLGRA
jgi:3-oxoacyl-[acyl-carrier-protein] synthase II